MNAKSVPKIFGLFIVFSIIVFVAHSFITQTSVFADAKFYFSITRSIIFDHNLLLGNEFFEFDLLKSLPPNEFIPTFYPPGVSIFWIPLFYITYGITHFVQLILPHLRFSGYELLYEYSAGLTSISLGIFALYLIFKMLSRYFSEQISLITVSALFLATNLFFYIAVEPINSHAASFFVSTLFIYYFLKRLVGVSSYFLLGIIGGFAGVVRTQDLLILILPFLYIIFRHRRSLDSLTLNIGVLSVGAIIGFFPQILLWKYFYNTFWYSPYIDTGFNFLDPQIFHVLFNAQNGLFLTTPLIIVAVSGILLKIIKDRDEKYIYALIYFLLQLYLISSWNDYSQGGSYSIRMIVTTYPLLAFGLANIMKDLTKRIGKNITLVLIFLFTAMNLVSIVSYLLKF